MQKFIKTIVVSIEIYAIISVILFFFGIMAGIFAILAWDKDNMRGKESCDWAYEKPHSYLSCTFSYPFKYGQRIGCFIVKPRFNLENNNNEK